MPLFLADFVRSLDIYLAVAAWHRIDGAPNGMQIEGKREIRKIATAVSAEEEICLQAVSAGVDALIVHHGLFWERDPYPLKGAKARKIKLLLEQGISLLAYHLPLDAHPIVGNNWKAARDLGWEQLTPFGEYQGACIGVQGTFSPCSVEILEAQLAQYYGHAVQSVRGGKSHVSSAALVSGGAYKQLPQAVAAGVDCYITGSADEPVWGWAREGNIHFFALGHAATEKVGPKALAAHLQKEWGIETLFLETQNPF